MNTNMLAIFHDEDGYIHVGYGNTPMDCYNDLISANEDTNIDINKVVFYNKSDIKPKVTFE